MQWIDKLRDWLGIDGVISTAVQFVENGLLAAGPSRYILAIAALVFVGFLVTRLLGGGNS